MITILFEDENILAIEKPAGISSIPERDLKIDSVVSLLEKQVGYKPFVVHRLDKEVTGVMLFAKTAAAHRYLNEEFFNRKVKKTYLALVHGTIGLDTGTIEKPIRQFGSGRMGIDEVKGKPSRTDFKVIDKKEAFSLLEAYPQSGRRHQIRVHLYSIGHAIVGDRFYGDKKMQEGFERLFLHAKAISFTNPDGKDLIIVSGKTADFEEHAKRISGAGK